MARLTPTTFHDRPMLFSGAMVRAILDGSKTKTRRLVRIDDTPITKAMADRMVERDDAYQKGIPTNAQNVRMCGSYLKCDAPPGSETVSARVLCPYGESYEFNGDRLWVRETHRVVGWNDIERATVEYQADGARLSHDVVVPDYDAWVEKHSAALERQGATVHGHDDDAILKLPEGVEQAWRPSIFLERWACRLLLAVERVTVERLQKITDEDILAEGVTRDVAAQLTGRPSSDFPTLRDAWAAGWDAINGSRAPWSSDPVCWVIEFRVESAVRAQGACP